MFANIYLREVFPNASEQHHPLQENTTHRQTIEKQSRSCEVCGKVYTYLGCLENHRQTHAASSDHRCEFCGKLVHSARKLNEHRRRHAENISNQIVAYIPAAVPVIEEEMRAIQRQKITKEATRKQNGHQCERCGRFFYSTSTRNRHCRNSAEKGHC